MAVGLVRLSDGCSLCARALNAIVLRGIVCCVCVLCMGVHSHSGRCMMMKHVHSHIQFPQALPSLPSVVSLI